MRQRKATTWQKVRKFFNDIHLWLGLISGILVVVICFSGTIYTYQKELTEWSASHLHWVKPSADGKKIPLHEVVPVILEESGGKLRSVYTAEDPTRSYRINVRLEGDNSRFGTTYYVNPYTGEILGTSLDQAQTKTSKFMRSMFSLHRWLLLDRIEEPLIGELPNRKLGSYISGAATILFTLGVITGLIIWFPQKVRNWKMGLKVKWNAGWKRVNHDLHNTLGFYSLIILFLMGITGPQWSFPWYRTGLQKFLGTYKEAPARGGRQAAASDNTKPSGSAASTNPADSVVSKTLPYETLLASVNEALPYKGDVTFNVADEDVISARKNKVGFFAPAAVDEVKINSKTGTVESVSKFKDKPFNERIAGSIKALHIGDVYGPFTKIIYFISCLIATTLPISGTLIWLNKLKKKPSRRRK